MKPCTTTIFVRSRTTPLCPLTSRFLVPLGISNDAKLLCALLFDRASLSRENGYLEPDGRVRLYFTVEEARDKLRRNRQVATRAFQEPERCGLIVRSKQGLGRPAKITLTFLLPQSKRAGLCRTISVTGLPARS